MPSWLDQAQEVIPRRNRESRTGDESEPFRELANSPGAGYGGIQILGDSPIDDQRELEEPMFDNLSRRALLRGLAGTAAGGWALAANGRWAKAEEQEFKVRAVTKGPKSHFFGYYEKSPWNADGRYLLAHQVDFEYRQPEPGEPLTVGLIDLEDGDRFQPLVETTAWCWQQGAMLQWLGSAPDREVIHNSFDADSGQYTATVHDIKSGESRTLPRPIYGMSADGKTAVSLDFDRLNRLRPGYGYMAAPERNADVAAPEDMGIYQMDIATGENQLIIPIRWAAENQTDDRFPGAHHWFNHLQFSPGRRFAFLHRWKAPEARSHQTRLYVANSDGSDRRLVWDTGMVSHYDWRDERTILAWTQSAEGERHFYLLDVENGQSSIMGKEVLTRDGHCSFSPDRQWVLNDTYADKERLQTLMLYRYPDGPRIDLGRFLEPSVFTGPYRCDLHPRWNRDGTQVCIDSTHEGNRRQMYVIDVRSVTAG